ncbi:MAG: GyrI-like domain-containing protein [Terracidiphilus sp.]
MHYEVVVEAAQSELVAAVRAAVLVGDIARAWKPALDQVWAFLKARGDLKPGLNFFLYHHGDSANEPIHIDFGVQVQSRFETHGNVRCIETPSGEVASTVHFGPYNRLGEAHSAIRAWCSAHNRKIGQASWEIYGHWNNDPAQLETTIKYLLAP